MYLISLFINLLYSHCLQCIHKDRKSWKMSSSYIFSFFICVGSTLVEAIYRESVIH